MARSTVTLILPQAQGVASMKAGLSIEEAVECLNKLERNIKAKFPEVAWCFVEPDNTD